MGKKKKKKKRVYIHINLYYTPTVLGIIQGSLSSSNTFSRHLSLCFPK